MFIPDAVMQNVWLLYRKSDASQSRPIDLFQKRSYRYLPPKILVSASWVRSVGRPILVSSRKLVKVPEPVRFDGQGHFKKAT